MTDINLELQVPISAVNQRLDQTLSDLLPDYSRSKLKQWILDGHVQLDGTAVTKPRTKLTGLEQIVIQTQLEAQVDWLPEPIAIDIVYEDEQIIVVNKSADMVVHPAAGNYSGTLVNALLHHCPSLEELPRAGIVHRLDKQTSGLLVVAKTLEAHTHLVNLLQARDISRHYLALCHGYITAGDTVDAPIARHPVKRKQMAVVASGKHAVTHYRVSQRYTEHTLLDVKLETGRTHQIRVHMAYIKHPLVGDPVYGGRLKLPKQASNELLAIMQNFKRQALHAAKLSFKHPSSGEIMSFNAPLPDDFSELIAQLKKEQQ